MAYTYTSGELQQWRERALNGPFKDAGDAFTNSPGDWVRIKTEAARFLSSDFAGMGWDGIGMPADQYQDPLGSPIGQVNAPIFGTSSAQRDTRMMSAVFVDLIENTTTYRAAVKSVILDQAQRAGTDFSNTTLFPTSGFDTNPDIAWTWAEWMIKYLRAYDFIGESNFTSGEQTIIRKWFRDFATWQQYLVNVKVLDNYYVDRTVTIDNYQLNTSHWSYGVPSTYSIYRGGPPVWSGGGVHNNRRFGQIVFIAYAGVLLNDTSFKNTGARAVREYIAFHWYESGYPMELHRSDPSRPDAGLGYTPITYFDAVEVAHILQKDGFTDLFAFTTTKTISPTTGMIVTGSVTKSLEWIALQFKAKFMDANAPVIYAQGTTGTSGYLLQHYCLSPVDSQQYRHRTKPAQGASLANQYYLNSLIEDIYFPDQNTLIGGFPSDPTWNGSFLAWTAVAGTLPGFMFMQADIDINYGVPVDPVLSSGWIDESIIRRW